MNPVIAVKIKINPEIYNQNSKWSIANLLKIKKLDPSKIMSARGMADFPYIPSI